MRMLRNPPSQPPPPPLSKLGKNSPLSERVETLGDGRRATNYGIVGGGGGAFVFNLVPLK